MKKIGFILLAFVMGCSTCPDEKKAWIGEWDAKWTTDPTDPSYAGLEDIMKFEMDGQFTFTCDEVTVEVRGYEKCIFNTDTLINTQAWELNDGNKLELKDETGETGLQYQVKSLEDDKIELILVNDIFVTLTR